MDKPFQLSIVLYRLTYPAIMVDRVRQLTLGQSDSLEGIFILACENLSLIDSITDDSEHPYCIRVEENGKLIALATVAVSGLTRHVVWLREPDANAVRQWQSDIDALLQSSFTFDDQQVETVTNIASRLKVKLIYNLMHTRAFARPTAEVYPTLYAVETRLGLQYARAHHISEALGI